MFPAPLRLSLQSLIAAASLALPCSGAFAAVDPITVEGNKVLFGGKPTSLAGVSLFHSDWGGKYYNANAVKAAKDEFGAKLVRAALHVEGSGTAYLTANGVVQDASNIDRVYTVIDAAIANDLYVLVDWHTHKAENFKPQAIKFFTEVAKKYGANPHIIYEIYNEPIGPNDNNIVAADYWKNTIKLYAVDVIAAIRAIDPDNLIIVGTGFYSQRVDMAAEPAEPAAAAATAAATAGLEVATRGAPVQWIRVQTVLGQLVAQGDDTLDARVAPDTYELSLKLVGRPAVRGTLRVPASGVALTCAPEREGTLRCTGVRPALVLRPG